MTIEEAKAVIRKATEAAETSWVDVYPSANGSPTSLDLEGYGYTTAMLRAIADAIDQIK